MLTILVKSIVSTDSNTSAKKVLSMPTPIGYVLLFKSVANTNTFITIIFTVYYIQQRSFAPRSSINKFNRMIVVEKNSKIIIVNTVNE